MMNEFAVGALSPKQQSLSRFKASGQVIIPINNRSNVKAKFRLEGVDHAGVCHFEFQLPDQAVSLTRQAEFWLLPGETIAIPVHITPPPNSLVGLSNSVYHFTITTTLLSGSQPSRSILGQLASTPLIGPWPVSLFTGCLVILLLFTFQAIITHTPADPQMINQTNISTQTKLDSPLAALPAVNEATLPPTVDEVNPSSNSGMTYEAIFQEIAPRYGLDWRLLAEIAYQESRMNPLAIGKDNDLGLMQIIPSTWNEWAPKVGVSDPFDPYSNVLVAAAYLAYVREYSRTKGYYEEHWMLIGYNWGPDNLRQLFESNEGWAQIPKRRRQYALDILQARSTASAHWQEY